MGIFDFVSSIFIFIAKLLSSIFGGLGGILPT